VCGACASNLIAFNQAAAASTNRNCLRAVLKSSSFCIKDTQTEQFCSKSSSDPTYNEAAGEALAGKPIDCPVDHSCCLSSYTETYVIRKIFGARGKPVVLSPLMKQLVHKTSQNVVASCSLNVQQCVNLNGLTFVA